MKIYIAATWFYIFIGFVAWVIGICLDAGDPEHHFWHHELVGLAALGFVGMTFWSFYTLHNRNSNETNS